MKLSALTPDTRNANKGTDRGRKVVRESLRKYGAGRSILIDKSGNVIAGNKTLEGAKAVGLEDCQIVKSDGTRLIAVQRTDLDINDKAARELAIADNRASELGLEWDADVLKALETEVDVDLSPFWDDRELVQFWADPNAEAPEPQLDRAAELQAKWDTKPGQLWLIGEHRLLCGDSTSEADVTRLMAGKRADACVTDPPYGIGLEYGGFKDSREGLKALVAKFLPLVRSVADVVALTPGVTNQWLYPEPNWVLCWFYGGGQLISSWGFNCWQPIIVYGKEPHLRRGKGAFPDAVDMNTPANAGDIDHPCPKPVPFWQWLVHRVTSDPKQIVIDVFAGSGTGFIACQTSERICYGIEIEPKYVAVTLQRLFDMGLQPVLADA